MQDIRALPPSPPAKQVLVLPKHPMSEQLQEAIALLSGQRQLPVPRMTRVQSTISDAQPQATLDWLNGDTPT